MHLDKQLFPQHLKDKEIQTGTIPDKEIVEIQYHPAHFLMVLTGEIEDTKEE